MLLARVSRATLTPQITSFLKAPVVSKPLVSKFQTVRLFASDGRTAFARSARKKNSIYEQVTAPAGETAFNIGKGAVAGGAALGIGALCFYGAGLSSSTGAIDHVALWPEHVKQRIRSTYMYFGASIISSAAAAVLCLRSPAVMNLVMRQSWVALGVSLAAMIGSGMVVHSIPYNEGFGVKQMAWLAHTGIMGAILAPICLMGGPLVMRAAWYTAGVVGGLSAVAVCAPSDKFLNMGGALGIGLGVVFASSLGSLFLPPTTAMGAGLHSMALYGGLLLFSMFLLYDTQRIIKQAETHPQNAFGQVKPFDPINNAISIYLDTLNIFIRILHILSGGGNRRK